MFYVKIIFTLFITSLFLCLALPCFCQLNSNYENSYNFYDNSSFFVKLTPISSIQDSIKLTNEQKILLYEKEKKNRIVAATLNVFFSPLALGHYYAGEPKRARIWHFLWAVGIGSVILAIENQSDFWGYFGTGTLAYAYAYSITDAADAADDHNAKLKKKYNITLNIKNNNHNKGLELCLSINLN